jgi:hypothetical protein
LINEEFTNEKPDRLQRNGRIGVLLDKETDGQMDEFVHRQTHELVMNRHLY